MEQLLIVSENCPACRSLEESLKDEINKGTIRVVDIASDEGADIALELGLNKIPEIITIVKTTDGKKVGLTNKVKVER